MKKLDVQHFLEIYKLRKSMQDDGTTNPRPEVKRFTREFVEKLSKLPPTEEIILREASFYDAKGNLIAKFPKIEED